jgi:hypothetical protein
MDVNELARRLVTERPVTLRDAAELLAPQADGHNTGAIVAELHGATGIPPGRPVGWDHGLVFEVLRAAGRVLLPRNEQPSDGALHDAAAGALRAGE